MTNCDVVLIDDIRSFKEGVRANPTVFRTEKAGLNWVSGLTADDAVKELWLDHDLGEDENGSVTSIMSIVHKLEEKVFLDEAPSIGLIVIHTSNPVGGRQIEQALGRHFKTLRVYAGDYLVGS